MKQAYAVAMVSVFVLEFSPINFGMAEPVFMKTGIYVIDPEPISSACFINPFHQSV
jgi:hypothetical protein